MKTNMTWSLLLLAAVLGGFCFRMGERTVEAAPLPVCQKWACKTVYAWWGSGATASSAEVVGGKPGGNGGQDDTNYCILNIFTPTSNENSPCNQSGNYDRWVWTSWNWMCKQGANAAPQEVTVQGAGQFNGTTTTRFVCTQ
jgi:hypothetical protein